MWIVIWDYGIEGYSISEDARFTYWLLRINGYKAKIIYRRNYYG
jgi:hypothetical protein